MAQEIIDRGSGPYRPGMVIMSEELQDKIDKHEVPIQISQLRQNTGEVITTDREEADKDEDKKMV